MLNCAINCIFCVGKSYRGEKALFDFMAQKWDTFILAMTESI